NWAIVSAEACEPARTEAMLPGTRPRPAKKISTLSSSKITTLAPTRRTRYHAIRPPRFRGCGPSAPVTRGNGTARDGRPHRAAVAAPAGGTGTAPPDSAWRTGTLAADRPHWAGRHQARSVRVGTRRMPAPAQQTGEPPSAGA